MRKFIAIVPFLVTSLALTGCSSSDTSLDYSSQVDGGNSSTDEMRSDPMDNISVKSIACEDWPGNAELLIENKNSELLDVSVTVAFIHEDGTVADTVTEYPSLMGNSTTRLIVERPEAISFSTCELAEIQLLTPMD